jgi:hypothetical protein
MLMQPIVEPNAIAALWPLDFAGIGVPFAKNIIMTFVITELQISSGQNQTIDAQDRASIPCVLFRL